LNAHRLDHLETPEELVEELVGDDIRLAVARLRTRMSKRLEALGFVDKIGRESSV
jgi:hypothetical protein